MKLNDIKTELCKSKYEFLNTNPSLGRNIVLLGLAGSYAYGTNHQGSDLDIRGIATNTKANITTFRDFEQIVDTGTDTVIYSFDKMMVLFASCNPSAIELLGLKPEHYLYVSYEKENADYVRKRPRESKNCKAYGSLGSPVLYGF